MIYLLFFMVLILMVGLGLFGFIDAEQSRVPLLYRSGVRYKKDPGPVFELELERSRRAQDEFTMRNLEQASLMFASKGQYSIAKELEKKNSSSKWQSAEGDEL